MNGIIGKPYKILYSSRNFVSGLTDIIAQVKKPDGSLHANYSLLEISGTMFQGTYSFDLASTQNDTKGEYSVVIEEQTSGTKQISKVSLQSESSGGSISVQDPEIYGKMEESILIGSILSDTYISGSLGLSILYGLIYGSNLIGTMKVDLLSAKISSEKLTGKIGEFI